ncbi:putative regulatory protein C.BcnI [Burkholderia pseudomallei TSV5]|nr:putative regulatory protein C.BcnI [Burkholderia pseudomallei TSV5]KGX50980.1 putative regulatory protein C.BcnI [Burkholderia pseudomallei TSV32]
MYHMGSLPGCLPSPSHPQNYPVPTISVGCWLSMCGYCGCKGAGHKSALPWNADWIGLMCLPWSGHGGMCRCPTSRP